MKISWQIEEKSLYSYKESSNLNSQSYYTKLHNSSCQKSRDREKVVNQATLELQNWQNLLRPLKFNLATNETKRRGLTDDELTTITLWEMDEGTTNRATRTPLENDAWVEKRHECRTLLDVGPSALPVFVGRFSYIFGYVDRYHVVSNQRR